VLVYPIGQGKTDPGYSGKILGRRPSDLLQSTEVIEQCLTPFCANAGDLFQGRGGSRRRPFLAVAGDSEAVRLVPNLL
jgi:hypothetical protein